MHVDFGIEIACDRKYAVDLATRVAVEIGRGADGALVLAGVFDRARKPRT